MSAPFSLGGEAYAAMPLGKLVAAFIDISFAWSCSLLRSFSVPTPAVIWPEWSISVPLLIFIIVSIDDKPFLSYDDVLAVISLHLCIVCGALLQYTTSTVISTGLLVFSCLFFLPCLFLMWKSSCELNALLKMSMASEAKRGLFQRRILLASRKATLSMCVGLLFPAFPVLYFLRFQGLLNDDLFLVLTMFASGFTKLCFASLCMDAHLEVSHPAFALIDAENFANTSRRAFLRFVFHEVRVPLNSISMGVQVLEGSPMATEDQETVSMMKDAVHAMGETLNDVMALQKVEEGSLELYYKPFSIADLFQNVEDSFLQSSVEHGVILSTDIDSRVPDRIIGDKFRLRHVLANLVSNALKYSYSGGHVQLRATLDAKANPTDYATLPTYESSSFLTIVFSVADEGKGVSIHDQEEDIFQPYRLLKPGELKAGRGTGLGLAICKEIVRMHHGQIWYTSKESVGSVFYVSIPFEVSQDTTKNTAARRNSSWRRRIQPDGTRRRLSTKLLSHWNVMMATPSQQDVQQCATPSPGGHSSSSNSFASYRSKRGGPSSSDEDVLVHPAVDGSDLFDVSHLTDRAIRELSEESSLSSATPKMRKPSFLQQRCDSSKSLELSDVDVANVQRYNDDHDDHDDVFGANDVPGTFSRDDWLASSASSDETSPRLVSLPPSEETDGQSTSVAPLPQTSPVGCGGADGTNGADVASSSSSSSEGTSSVSTLLTPTRSWSRKPPRASPSGNHALSASGGGTRLSVSFHGIDTIMPDVDSQRHAPSTASLFGPLPQVAEGVSPLDMSPSPGAPSPTLPSSQSPSSPTPPPPPPPPPPPVSPFGSPSDRMTGTTDESLKTTVLHSLNRQGVASISTPPSSPSASRSSYYNILIVDDVLSNRKLLALLLNKRGIHSITFAADGMAGVETVKDKGIDAFDLIFMDNTMPHLSGIEASRIIRKLGYDNLIIGVTGNSMEDELTDFLQAGADFAITKPMKPNVLDILLQYMNTFGCRSHPNERLVIRNTSLEWVRLDSHGRPKSDRQISSLK
jgi:signal transduction histidine kinase/CheY-like chemotaxis protein